MRLFYFRRKILTYPWSPSIDPVTRHPKPLRPYIDEVKEFFAVSFSTFLLITEPSFKPFSIIGNASKGSASRPFTHRWGAGTRGRLPLAASSGWSRQNRRWCMYMAYLTTATTYNRSNTAASLHDLWPLDVSRGPKDKRSHAERSYWLQFNQHTCIAAYICLADPDAWWCLAIRQT